MKLRTGAIRGYRITGTPRNGLPAGGGYVYRGTKFITEEEIAAAVRAQRANLSRPHRKPGDPIDHGTTRGYQQELRAHVETCVACKAAHTEAIRASKARRKAAA